LSAIVPFKGLGAKFCNFATPKLGYGRRRPTVKSRSLSATGAVSDFEAGTIQGNTNADYRKEFVAVAG
jgi:hypothetical protein